MRQIIETQNGIEKVEYEFTKEELELLSQPLPDSPCNKCRDSEFCLGCPEYEQFKIITKKYEEKGVLEFAIDLSMIRNIQKKISKWKKESDEIRDGLPEQLKDLVKE